jgi:hypothetical protein
MVLSSSFPAQLVLISGPEEAKNLGGGRDAPPNSDPFRDAEFDGNLACLSIRFAASAEIMPKV